MRLGSRPCDYRCGVTIQRDRRPGSLPHPEPSRAPDLDLSLHPTLPCPAHSAIMLTVKYREMLAIACAEKSYGEFRFSSESDAWDWSAMRYVSVFPTGHVKCGFGWLCVRFCRIGYSDCVFWNRTFVVLVLVRAGGVEPPRAYTHCHLKTARLPFRHARRQSTNLHRFILSNKSACRDWQMGVKRPD